jgi:Fe2+ or Zn2+ uptake regulation protein
MNNQDMPLLISFSSFGIFIAMTDRDGAKKTGRKRMTANERRKILDIHIEDPRLPVKEIAARGGMKLSTVYKILSQFKDGKIDRDGFQYEKSLCL